MAKTTCFTILALVWLGGACGISPEVYAAVLLLIAVLLGLCARAERHKGSSKRGKAWRR